MDKIQKIDLHCHLDGSIPFAFCAGKKCRAVQLCGCIDKEDAQ